MKIKIPLIILTLLFLTCSCTSFYYIKDNQEYVRITELGLSKKDQFELHWITTTSSEYAIYCNRSERFYYLKEYNYKKLLNE